MEKNRGHKRSFVILFILLLIPIAYAFSPTSFFENIGNIITGKASSSLVSTNLTVGNTAPTVKTVSAIAAQTITEDSTTTIYFSYLVNDPDGRTNLDDTKARANFSKAGEDVRTNSSCATEADIGTDANYSCKIDLWYWDGTGNWNVTAYAQDLSGAGALNNSWNGSFFNLGETTGVKMSPAALTWPSVNPGATNTLATNFITINNTCNDDIASGNVRTEAINLTGEQTSTYNIMAGNFTSKITQACEGTQLVESVATGVASSILAAGNHSVMNNITGQETLFFCAETIPSNIISQSYSTNKSLEPWTIDVI